MTEPLLPPEAHRQQRWHWLINGSAPFLVYWHDMTQHWEQRSIDGVTTAEAAWAMGWRYHAPDAGPDAAGELAALRAKVNALDEEECRACVGIEDMPDMSLKEGIRKLTKWRAEDHREIKQLRAWLDAIADGHHERGFGTAHEHVVLDGPALAALTAYRAQREGEKHSPALDWARAQATREHNEIMGEPARAALNPAPEVEKP